MGSVMEDSDDSLFANVDEDGLTTPKIIGGYEMGGEEMGVGSWGRVKLGRDSRTGQLVAVKIFFRPRLERKLKGGLDRLYGYRQILIISFKYAENMIL